MKIRVWKTPDSDTVLKHMSGAVTGFCGDRKAAAIMQQNKEGTRGSSVQRVCGSGAGLCGCLGSKVLTEVQTSCWD